MKIFFFFKLNHKKTTRGICGWTDACTRFFFYFGTNKFPMRSLFRGRHIFFFFLARRSSLRPEPWSRWYVFPFLFRAALAYFRRWGICFPEPSIRSNFFFFFLTYRCFLCFPRHRRLSGRRRVHNRSPPLLRRIPDPLLPRFRHFPSLRFLAHLRNRTRPRRPLLGC